MKKYYSPIFVAVLKWRRGNMRKSRPAKRRLEDKMGDEF
jgi:hypothetical protein